MLSKEKDRGKERDRERDRDRRGEHKVRSRNRSREDRGFRSSFYRHEHDRRSATIFE